MMSSSSTTPSKSISRWLTGPAARRGWRKASIPVQLLFGGIFLIMLGLVSWGWSSTQSGPSSGVGLRHFSTPSKSLRLFGPALTDELVEEVVAESSKDVSHLRYGPSLRRMYMQRYATKCVADGNLEPILSRYDGMSSWLQIELWKYCMLYMGHGNVFVDDRNEDVVFLVNQVDLFSGEKRKKHVGVKLDTAPLNGRRHAETDVYVHGSLLRLSHSKSNVARQMLLVLMETPDQHFEDHPLLLEKALGATVSNEKDKWVLLEASCQQSAPTSSLEYDGGDSTAVSRQLTSSIHLACPMGNGGFCCQVMQDELPLLALRHPVRDVHADTVGKGLYPYFSTVDVEHLITDPADRVTPLMTPNFFDILLQNDCLPTQKACHRCLKKKEVGCAACMHECPCYCATLCRVRPPPKQITQEWTVRAPIHQVDPKRLIPKRIHQTWYEPVTKEKYPNMSRLIESWKQSGWSYHFYSDEDALSFLSEHFPPEVVEAYEAILPGAFKADLFRYCVLLIQGGVYADMDVLLETHLDQLFLDDVGFLVPMDEPGIKVGARSCLWNGLLAVAPGHPFLARTIEIVVNNVRNRFTSVDYDDMLCPNPVLSVSHSVDTLFTCGPCILGAAMNQVLGRHMQEEWTVGDVDIWGTDRPTKEDPRWYIPGRTIILDQNKQDMGAHRFTWTERNLMVAATDMPDYDDRPKSVEHYSKTHEKAGVYGLKKLYVDSKKANEEIRILVKSTSSLN